VQRVDRLFRIVQYLRGRRLTTATQLATWLKVSERTIYRDIAELMQAGTPVEGEAGVGYRLQKGMALPPLMFEIEEIEAIALGTRMVEAWSSPALAASAQSALAKIASALPATRRAVLEDSRAFVPQLHIPAQLGERFERARLAIRERKYLQFVYAEDDKTLSACRVRPLSLYFWGEGWTLAAWCEQRQDFHSFSLDRMLRMSLVNQRFADETGKRLADYARTQGVKRKH
jgi:predicted DNA-binding transcriptional regulator YafY